MKEAANCKLANRKSWGEPGGSEFYKTQGSKEKRKKGKAGRVVGPSDLGSSCRAWARGARQQKPESK